MVPATGSAMAPPPPGPPPHHPHSMQSHPQHPVGTLPPPPHSQMHPQMNMNPQAMNMNPMQQQHHQRGVHPNSSFNGNPGNGSQMNGQMNGMMGGNPNQHGHPNAHGHQHPMASHPPPLALPHQAAMMKNGPSRPGGSQSMSMQQQMPQQPMPLHQQQQGTQQMPPGHRMGMDHSSTGHSSSGQNQGWNSQQPLHSRNMPQQHQHPQQYQHKQQNPQSQQQLPHQQQQHKQKSMGQGANESNGSWQSQSDMQHRRRMIAEIVKLLKQRDWNSANNPEWLRKLPQMVKQLEISLYKSAPSFEAYSDVSTLKHRLQKIAQEIGVMTAQQQGQQGKPGRNSSMGQQQRQLPQSQGNNSQHPIMPHQQQQYAQQQQMLQTRQQQMAAHLQQRNPSQSQSQSQRDSLNMDKRQMVNMADINPSMISSGSGGSASADQGSGSMMGNSPSLPPAMPQPTPLDSLIRQNSGSCGDDSLLNQQLNMMTPSNQFGGNQQQSGGGLMPLFGSNDGNKMGGVNSSSMKPGDVSKQHMTSPAGPSGSSGGMGGSSSSMQRPNDPEWSARTRQRQQRLLLLHHASKCHVPETERCRVTPFCGDMKRLWKHMGNCSDPSCRVRHCVSSRSIISHYKKCKDPKCPSCGPVRETVRKSGRRHARQHDGRSSGDRRQQDPSKVGSQSQMGSPSPYPQQPSQMDTSSSGYSMTPNSHMPNGMSPMNQMMGNSHNGSMGGTGSSGMSGESPSPSHPQMNANFFGGGNTGGVGGNHSNQSMGGNGMGLQPLFPNDSSQNFPGQSGNGPAQQSGHAPNMGGSSRGSSGGGSGGNDSHHRDPEWQLRVKHRQQRLLLLRHASKCTYEEERCPVTPHCAAMKQLWNHIAVCKEPKCTVQHCLSSRSVLSHYRKCKDPRCLSCEPVRQSIRRSHEKQKERSSHNGQSPRHRPQMDSSKKPHAPVVDMNSSMSSKSAHPPKRVKIDTSSTVFGATNAPAVESSSPVPKQAMSDPGGARNGIMLDRSLSPVASSTPVLSPVPAPAPTSAPPESQGSPSVQSSGSFPPAVSSPAPKPLEAPKVESSQVSSSDVPNESMETAAVAPPTSVPAPLPAPEVGSMGPPEETKVQPPEPPMEKPAEEAVAPTPQPVEQPSSQSGGKPALQPPKKQGAAPVVRSAPPSGVQQGQSSKEASKPQEDHSLINSFTMEQIETHIASLNRVLEMPPAKLKSKCLEILKGLQSHQHGWVFNCPVDPVELGLPDYFDIIKRPMDLGTIQKRLESGSYHGIEEFESDVRLTFDNAMTYNQEGTVVHNMAKEMKEKFAADYDKLISQLKAEEVDRRKNERACTLCGCEKLLFEPPVYFCNGMNCASKRIRRNSHYYVGGNNQYYWCNQCYNELKESTPIELVDLTVKKSDLKKKKNDEVHEESWVQCDTCERWIHQICSLFNARQNKEHRSEYSCPSCTLEKRKKGELSASPQAKPPMAVDLPKTKLSEWLEKHVRRKVKERMRSIIKEKADTENLAVEEAEEKVKRGGHVTIRQVTSADQKLEVRERMRRRYKNYPEEFPYRCKCILVFQNLDGVDVVLFALYLYEHGADNPAPNTRVVYVSYLDSVHFMRPRKMRTFIYHEILIAYLDYATKKGFSTAHIWACPPLKGDDYIFYSKPKDQKTPRDDRLRQWYIDMLVECQKRNIVGRITNMYDLYFTDEKNDASVVPYLDGDYFPGEAENIIKELEEGGGKKKGSGGKKNKKKNGNNKVNGEGNKSKNKNKGSRGTRSTGLEDEMEVEKKEVVNRDHVMVQLGETIKPMKESFIVAFLNWERARSEDMVVPKEIIEEREKRRIERENNPEPEDSDPADSGASEVISLSGEKTSKGKKRSFDGSVCPPRSSSGGRTIKIIDDDVEDLDCEFFNNRQSFLNLCRGNHYQFDELRRAKHTSMMVLWHLHNRDAPKFVQQCAACSREIVSGTRYHCPTCTPDFDLCAECYANPKTDRGQCTHKLEPIQVESGQSSTSGSTLTEAQRRERQRNIQLHVELLEHASSCASPTCNSSNCLKMKGFLKHWAQCKQKANGGCKICKRIWTLLRIHAQQCKKSSCSIPQCMAIRERIRQLQQQQQAWDDRRRQDFSRTYRGGAGGAGGHAEGR